VERTDWARGKKERDMGGKRGWRAVREERGEGISEREDRKEGIWQRGEMRSDGTEKVREK